MSLADKIALVTGASRGIGRATAMLLAKQGAIVVGTATTEQGAAGITEYLKDLKESNNKSMGLVMDISDAKSVESTLSTIQQTLGQVAILVNNAGITSDNLFLRMKAEEWSKVIHTNLTGTYYVTHACIRAMMKAKWGRIVNISSVVGSIGNAGQANYCAAKAGLLGFTKSLARELGSRGITVNAIAPGFIETDMTNELPEENRQQLLNQIPLARIGTPQDIAEAVLFLVDKGGDYITGETLHVNGGMHMA